jgi:hypothetical protein
MSMLDSHSKGCKAIIGHRYIVNIEALFLLSALYDLLLDDLEHLLVVAFLTIENQHLLESEVVLLMFVRSGTGTPSLHFLLVDCYAESCRGTNR